MNLRSHTSCIVLEFFPPLRGWGQLRDANQQKRWPRDEGLLSLKSVSLTKRTSLGASSPGGSGGGRGKWRRACNYVPGIWIPPPIPLWLPVDWAFRFPPISAKAETSANVNKHWKTRGKGNDVITNVISANRHFASTFSMQIFKFQRRSCKLSFLFPPCRQSAPGELARRLQETFVFLYLHNNFHIFLG